jgi:hypothetical protein
MTHIQTKKSQLAEYDIVIGYLLKTWLKLAMSGGSIQEKKIEFIKEKFNLKVAHCFY